MNTEGVTAINNFNLDNIGAAAAIRSKLQEKGIVYMVCDFVPSDERQENYYEELIDSMSGAEGLIVCPYVAPAIELNKGQYAPAARNRMQVAGRVFKKLQTICHA